MTKTRKTAAARSAAVPFRGSKPASAPEPADHRGAVLSVTIDGCEPQDVAIYLDQIFDIGVRSGLHCAPYAHEAIGTLNTGGTVRISPGYFTTEEEIDACIEALGIIARGEI